MVVGLGTDIVSVARFHTLLAHHGARFRRRCFRPGELASLGKWPGGEPAGIAACWAAKEAFLKALGVRVTAIPYRQIEVKTGSGTAPELVLHDEALVALDRTGAQNVVLSLSQAGDFAQAMVILEGT